MFLRARLQTPNLQKLTKTLQMNWVAQRYFHQKVISSRMHSNKESNTMSGLGKLNKNTLNLCANAHANLAIYSLTKRGFSVTSRGRIIPEL